MRIQLSLHSLQAMLTILSTRINLVVYNLVYDIVDMNKPPISFRLTDKEWEVLEREQQSDESINQTAARLLREKLGIQNVDSEYTLENNTLSNWISDEINKKLQSTKFAIESLAEDKINQEIINIKLRLEEVEAKLAAKLTRKPRTPKTATMGEPAQRE